MSTSTKSRKENKPVHGSCRWTHLCHDISAGRIGVLDINGTCYAVTIIAGGIELRKGDGTVYHVCTSERWGWSCDCPDAQYRPRPGGCKHVAACRAALDAIGVEPKPAAPSIPARTAAPAAELEDL
jgi:hypothetical protein